MLRGKRRSEGIIFMPSKFLSLKLAFEFICISRYSLKHILIIMNMILMKTMKRYTLKRDRGKVAGKSWWWYIYIRGGREFEIIQAGEISSKRFPRLWHPQDIWSGIVLHQTQFWKWSFFWDFYYDTDYDFALLQLEWIILSI